MTATAVETPSPVYTEWTVGELEIPCDYGDDPVLPCPNGAAKWALYLTPHSECPGCNGVRLACDRCKDFRMNFWGVECVECGWSIKPARAAYARIEAL